MGDDAPDATSLGPAEQLFADWLGRRGARGGTDFEALLRAHPGQAHELARLHADWKRIELLRLRAGADASQPSAPLARRLEARFGPDVDPGISLERPEKTGETVSQSKLVRRLSEHALERSRYELKGEIARGGMGAILKVWDEDLRRSLAMKVLLTRVEKEAAEAAQEPRVDRRTLARFLEEAQITGQLDHPGIVPVHELGLDAEGRVFFTMKLVRGRNLKQIIELARSAKEGWSVTRALTVVLKVCEAMAYAHAKGVIHRDLKPANVMVGHYGEVYVMDWGLARVIGRKDPHDIRPELSSTSFSIRTERREAREETPDSPLLTMGGDVVGTPAYMSPEQARGEVERLTARSDVYSLGAMLYHLLTGQMPYVPPNVRVSSRTVLLRVIEGPPRPVHELDESVPAELEAICDKAMAREPEERYTDTSALAEDLRAYLEHRVVHAYETGAVAELRKWIVRNKALAGASAAGILALVAGLAASAYLYVQARRHATEALRNEEVATVNAALARENEALARKRAEEVLRLSAIQDLDRLVAEADRLWPAHPENAQSYEGWLRRANALLSELPRHEATLAELGQRLQPDAEPFSPASQDRWWHDELSGLVQGLRTLSDPERGLLSTGVSPEHGWGVPRRLEFARSIEERSIAGPEAASAWDEARASIADPSACPWYGGLELAPEIGLLPIGRDPSSGLWEFAHLQSGEPARRAADGSLVRTAETGLVLVLIPGGRFWMGAQRADPAGRNFDPSALAEETNVHEVALEPFFLAKHELTQAQWSRVAGHNPSFRDARIKLSESDYALRPVEQVSWFDCDRITRWLGLILPGESQWEYAARAGTSSIWWTGDEPETLEDAANIADLNFGRALGAESWEVWLDDGYELSAPTGSFAPNGFGLHDVHGNVYEWCANFYDNPYLGPPDASQRVMRGGSFYQAAVMVRSAFRMSSRPEQVAYNIGLRPARELARR